MMKVIRAKAGRYLLPGRNLVVLGKCSSWYVFDANHQDFPLLIEGSYEHKTLKEALELIECYGMKR